MRYVMRNLLNIVADGPTSVSPGRLIWLLSLVRAGLWLATSLVSALLVYWLHFKPVYTEDWTAAAGSVVFAGLAIYAAINCVNTLGQAFSGVGKPHQPVRR
jgi:hypothetical protein